MTFEEALDKVNILVISNEDEDYEEVLKMGFKNVSFFKSIIVADHYFKNHPDDLEKYNLIIQGEQKVQRVCFYGDTALDNKINRLSQEVGKIYTYDFDNNKSYHLWFARKTHSSNTFKSILNDYLDKLLKCAELCKKIQNQEAVSTNIPEVPRKPYPKSKRDLHVLFLASGCVYDEFVAKSAEELGMDVTFVHDSNNALGQNVIHHIGEYDIIIASKCYSQNLLDMHEEFKEQGRLTGLSLGLVAIYEDESIYTHTSDDDYAFNLYGYELIYKSRLGGIEVHNQEINEDIFQVLKHPHHLLAKSLIERALVDYHNELKELNGVGLNDVFPATFKHYAEDYKTVMDEYEEAKKAFKENFLLFNSISEEARRYLINKKRGLIKAPLKDLSIKETENGIKIEMYTLGRKICALTLSKNTQNKYHVFSLQTIKDNGSLSGPTELSFYPLEKNFSLPRPSEKQLSILSGLWKKMEVNLVPINASCNPPKSLQKKPHNKRKPHYKKNYSY